MLVDGSGVEQNERYGMMLVGRAAERGSAGAALTLARSFETGNHGLPKDLAQAKEWYEKVASAKVCDLNADGVERVAARLRVLSD
eukprot:508555-Prymnesium_polylepis.2